jgi:bacterioferritin-associated ferredoxin
MRNNPDKAVNIHEGVWFRDCTGFLALNGLYYWQESVYIKTTKTTLDSEKKVINNFKKICICRSIKGGTILKAMEDGALSFEALRRTIRVGTGNCKAKRCRKNIEKMVSEFKEDQGLSLGTQTLS